MSPEELKSIIRRNIEEGWNKGALEIIDEYYAPDYTYRNPSFPQVKDREDIKRIITKVRSSYPDAHFTIEDMIAEGNKVVMRYTFRGTDKGGSVTFGTPPTGKRVTMESIAICRFEGNKIAEEWELQDSLGLMRQLEVVPQAAAAR